MRKLVYCKIAVSLAAYSLFLLFLPSTSNAQTLQTVTRAGQSTPYCIRATGDSIGTVSGPGAELNYSGGVAYLNGLNRTTSTYIPLTIQASVVSTNTRLCVNGASDDGSSALQVKGDLAISGALGIIIDVDSTTGYTTRTCSLEPSPLETRTVRFNCSSTDPGGGWEFYNSNTSKSLMYVTQNGNIGVNTTHPLSTFSVQGTVTAQVLNIAQTGWSDFVFDSTYQRMPLNQVAAYVHQYKHLPGIPSAGQIAAS